MKILDVILMFSLIIIFTTSNIYAADIEVVSVMVTYNDDKTVPGKTIIRDLKIFKDDGYWSKPNKANIKVVIRNNSDVVARFISVKPELYILLKNLEESKFKPIENYMTETKLKDVELKSINADKLVWVWNKVLGSKAVRELSPKKETIITFEDVPIRSEYYATDYSFVAVAVRVFAIPRDIDTNMDNNVTNYVIYYSN